MTDLQIYILDKSNAGPFTPYLMPQVRQYIGDGKALIALGAVRDNHSVGAVAASVENGALHIVSLYVDPKVRRQGIGSVLLCALGGIVNANDLHVEGARAYFMEEDGMDVAGLTAFLRYAGFGEPQLSDRLFSVDTADLHDLPGLGAAFSTEFQPDPHIRPFSAITPEQLREIEDDPDVMDCLKPSAMRFHPMRSASMIWVEDGHVLGYILAYQGVDGEIVVASSCKRAGAPKGCWRQLLYGAANRCYVMLGRDYKAYILTINDHSLELVEQIAGSFAHEYKNFVAETGKELPSWLLPDEDEENGLDPMNMTK